LLAKRFLRAFWRILRRFMQCLRAVIATFRDGGP